MTTLLSSPPERLNRVVPASRRSDGKLLVGFFAVALLIRLGYLFQIEGSVLARVTINDGFVYDRWAREIVAGDALGREVFFQAPLYPYFLAALYAVFERDLFLVRLVQALLGATACVLLALAGLRFFERRSGLIAGGILALYGPALFDDGLIQKASLDLFLSSALLVSLAQLAVGGANGWALAAGVALGALSLNRENALALFPVLAAWPLLRSRAGPVAPRLRAVGLLTAGMALVLLPVGIRNWRAGGEFLLTTAQFGPNLYIGNSERANGTYVPLRPGGGSALLERRDATELAERVAGKPLSPRQVSDYWAGRALAHVRSHPGRSARLTARKCLMAWNAAEITDSEALEAYADQSPLLRNLAWLFHFGTLAPLAALGVVWTWGDRKRLFPLYAILACVTVSVAIFFVFGRYRYPLVPALALFAGAGFAVVPTLLRARAWRRIAAGVAALVVTAVLVNAPRYQDESPRVTTYYNLGVTLSDQGRREAAIVEYRKALSLHTDAVEPRYNLANELAQLGRLEEAVAEYRLLLRWAPSRAPVQNNLAITLERQGRYEEAIPHYREALRLAPDLPTAQPGLVRCLARSRKG